MSYDYVDNLLPEDKGRYNVKLELLGLDKCPYKLPADRWINDPKQWPKIEYNDVYHYLIKSPRLYSPEAMENYRSTDAHRFFISGWVQTVFHIKLDSGDVLLKADVRRSYNVNEIPHHPWLALRRSGQVIAAHCDCTAGTGETCSHVGALLYKMEAAVRLGYTSSACTDLPCKWNACFTQNVQPSPVADIRFYKQEAKDRLKKSNKKLKTIHEPATMEEQNKFLMSLSELPEPVVGLSTFSGYSDSFLGLGPSTKTVRLPPTLRTLYKNGNENLDNVDELLKSAKDNLKISADEVDYVEESTRNQSSSGVWHDQRAGRITSSTVHDILRTDANRPAPSIVKKICQTDKRQIKAPAIEWGNRNEHNAYLLYVNLQTGGGQKPDIVPTGVVMATHPGPHHDCVITKSGFVICEKEPSLGVSPDGRVTCKCCGKGLLEIKCPYKYREASLTDAFKSEDFYITQNYGLKETHRYFTQVQLQMYVCDVLYVDFLVWTPVDCIISRVYKNSEFISCMVKKLETVWLNHILPEIVTRKSEKKMDKENKPLASCSTVSDVQTYCVCKTTEDSGAMVACDKCDMWYHPECLGLKRLPSKKVWYCPSCRKLMKMVK